MAKTQFPCFPRYKSYNSRIKSFDDLCYALPFSTTVDSFLHTREELASCGYFYNKQNQSLTCFHCSGSFVDYTFIDLKADHLKYFPHCEFISNKIQKDEQREQTKLSLCNNCKEYKKTYKNVSCVCPNVCSCVFLKCDDCHLGCGPSISFCNYCAITLCHYCMTSDIVQMN